MLPESNPRWEALASSAIGVMLLILLAKILGFGEKLGLAYFAGAAASVDAYFVAVSTAFSLYVLVDDILVPVFLARYVTLRKQHGTASAYPFYRRVLATTGLVLAVIVIATEVSANRVVSLLVGGFDEEQLHLTVTLLRWTLPGGFFLGLAGLTYVLLNAHQRFAWPAAAGALYKLVIVMGVVTLLPVLGIRGAAMAMCVAAVIQFAFHLLGVRRWVGSGRQPQPAGAPPQPEAARLIRLMLPLAVGTLAAQASVFVDNNRGATLAVGSLSAIGYARRLVDLPILLVPNVLGIVAFPKLVALTATGRIQQMVAVAADLMAFCLLVFLPVSVVCVWAPEPIVGLVYGRGRFDATAVAMTGTALRFFSIGLAAYTIEIIILRAYYATLDTVTPIAVGLGFVALNIAMTIALTPTLGLVTIPLALATQKTLKVAVLLGILVQRHPGEWAVRLLNRFGRIALCVAAFTIVFGLSRNLMDRISGDGTWHRTTALAAAVLLASSFYIAALQAAGLVNMRELPSFWRALRAKVLGSRGSRS